MLSAVHSAQLTRPYCTGTFAHLGRGPGSPDRQAALSGVEYKRLQWAGLSRGVQADRGQLRFRAALYEKPAAPGRLRTGLGGGQTSEGSADSVSPRVHTQRDLCGTWGPVWV